MGIHKWPREDSDAMVLRLLKAVFIGILISTIHIITHLVFGDVSSFSEAGVYAAGIAVFLSSTITSYLLLD